MIAIQKNSPAGLTDSQLIMKLDALVEKERETTLEVLRHIIEFERRKLYLGIGYGSMFEYATRRLGYSESAAQQLRIPLMPSVTTLPRNTNGVDLGPLPCAVAAEFILYGAGYAWLFHNTLPDQSRHESTSSSCCRLN